MIELALRKGPERRGALPEHGRKWVQEWACGKEMKSEGRTALLLAT